MSQLHADWGETGKLVGSSCMGHAHETLINQHELIHFFTLSLRKVRM